MEELSDKEGTRILFASGNGGKNSILRELTLGNGKIEGVGSLNEFGDVSEFSASRYPEFTKHYKCGEYKITAIKGGLNITGKPGLEIPYKKGSWIEYLTSKDLSTELIKPEEFDELLQATKLYSEGKMPMVKYSTIRHKYHDKIFKAEDALKLLGDGHQNADINGKYIHIDSGTALDVDKNGKLIPYIQNTNFNGTSFSTPVRAGKLALNRMMKNADLST